MRAKYKTKGKIGRQQKQGTGELHNIVNERNRSKQVKSKKELDKVREEQEEEKGIRK